MLQPELTTTKISPPKFDSTALPGRKRKDDIFNFDWINTPNQPYKPSKKDYRIPAKKQSRKFTEIPFTMIPIKTFYDKKYYNRYLNLTFDSKLLARGLKKIKCNTKKIISTFHPYELFFKKKKSIFINNPNGLKQNLYLIQKKFSKIKFTTIEDLVLK